MLIHDGLVRVNGRVQHDPETPVRLEVDTIAISQRPIAAKEFIYLMVNKPRGLVTTASDEKGRATIYSLLDTSLPWVAPVGRLDKASEGLLLVTNDSEWAARILSPDSEVEKTYHVQIRSNTPEEVVRTFAKGVQADGEILHVARATTLRQGRYNAWLEIVLREGKNRHIRRMLAACGVEVLRLVRVSIGPLALGKLAKGATRLLTAVEKRELDAVLDPGSIKPR